MNKYNTIEDFLQLIKYYDLVYVKIGHEVYIELKSLHLVLEISTLFPSYGQTKIIVQRGEYEREILDKTKEIIFQQRLKECTSIKNYFSVEDFENEPDKRNMFIETENDVWINLHHYGNYDLKEIFHYSNPKYLIFKCQYDQEALDAYLLMKKMTSIKK